MTDAIPDYDSPDARIDWIIKRAQMLDFIRGSDWIADEIETLWNNPHEFEQGMHMDPPEEISEEAYALFSLGVLFGTDYEFYFPRENQDEWITTEESDD